MAKSADATDLKSVIHWVYGFKSRSGYHFLEIVLYSRITCGGPSCALTKKRAGKLVNVSSRRPALFSSSSHDHPADWKWRGSEIASLELRQSSGCSPDRYVAAAVAADVPPLRRFVSGFGGRFDEFVPNSIFLSFWIKSSFFRQNSLHT